MISSLCCLALALPQQTAALPAAPASLRELVAASELIAWVRVEDVRAIDLGDSPALRHVWPHGDAPYASLAVESVVFGDGESPGAPDARLRSAVGAWRDGARRRASRRNSWRSRRGS